MTAIAGARAPAGSARLRRASAAWRAASADRAFVTVVACSCAAALLFATLGILRQRAYHSAAMDFAFFDQIVWNTSQGRFFETSFVPYNFLGQHFEPVLLLFAGLYLLSPSPEWLLVVQALAAGGAGIALYLYARERLASPWLAALVALTFLLSPTLHRAIAFDYHSEVMTPLLVFAGLALLMRGRESAGIAVLLSLLLLKEDAALVLIGLALPLWLMAQRRTATLLALAGTAWIVLVVGLLMPAIRGGASDIEGRYTHLGSGAGGIASGIASDPVGAIRFATGADQVEAVARQLAFQGGLPLLAPVSLAAAAPVTALQLLSSHEPQQSLRLHYGIQVLPLVVVATVEGLRRLERSQRAEALTGVAARLLVAGTVVGFLFTSPLPLGNRFEDQLYRRPVHAATIERALAQIPDHAAVSAQSGLAAHLSQRERIWEFPVLEEAEYVVLDLDGIVARPYRAVYAAEVARLDERGYLLIWSDGSLRVYRKAGP